MGSEQRKHDFENIESPPHNNTAWIKTWKEFRIRDIEHYELKGGWQYNCKKEISRSYLYKDQKYKN